MARGPWLTLNFVPATKPLIAFTLRNPGDSAAQPAEVVGWLVQHRYPATASGSPLPTDSRVIAAVFAGRSEVEAVDAEHRGFLGVYPEGELPPLHTVEARKRAWMAGPDR